MARILVTGGAGFIGSHMVAMLIEQGHDVVVFDNLSSGHADAVSGVKLIVADLADKDALNACFSEHNFNAVMHFAALIQVGESVENPIKYYQNNLVSSINLLNAMVEHKVDKLIFSSSAAVYGEPQYTPVDIRHPKNPINPYGKSKWILEMILEDYAIAYNFNSISLRYFNACGADPEGRFGPRHSVVSHLIPLVLQAASGRRKHIEVYGTDYPTRDGTCIRDYVHVSDLCRAHLLALKTLLNGSKSKVYNLGNGKGYSVLEVIQAAEKIVGKKIPTVLIPRRAGDPAALVADAELAKEELLWCPKHPDLESIIKHSWQWEQRLAGK